MMSYFDCTVARITTALTAAAALLVGCGTAPAGRGDTPAALLLVAPDRWQAGDATAPVDDRALVHWWSAFGDPVLTQLVEQALQANPDVLAARAALAQARAQRDVTQAGTGISVDARLQAQRAQSGSSAPRNGFRAGLDASWEADLFGRQAAALQASDAEVAASAASLRQARVSLAAEVAATYFDWWGYRERLRVARNNLIAQQEGLQLTQWRVQAGLASRLELESARAAVEQTRAALPALEASARQARFALAVLTGRPPGADVPEPLDAGPTPPAAGALPIPAAVLRQRPDVAG
ncbi:MAG: TolC family protein, partial [Tepidimonas sp.]|uniref:TolC family protein n=1 Tax=Tepidimonas sp. TaxID=2002775 RepID=UPI004054EF81